ncbi:BREX protein BrxB domain-containing protein [Nocardia sp. R6R-6]|uniref:BREX protein BrxB domain-containing protein n=1 Tax=Nocardia sp. R6R-6 TaxID=3459303 RepID=UPI00403DA7CC
MTTRLSDQLSLTERFELAYRVMRTPSFLEMKGQIGEVPYFVLAYRPSDEPNVAGEHRRLVTRLRKDGIEVCDIDLWHLATELWSETGVWAQIIEQETALPKEMFGEAVGNVISPREHLSPRITRVVEEQQPRPQVVMLSNVGRLYPLVRAHTVLNTLQPLLADLPVVLVFPGTYRQSPTQGSSLVLFDRLTDDDYYRAFDLLELENS